MLDLRPVGYVVGLLVAFLGAAMMVPMTLDLVDGDPSWQGFFQAGTLSILIGLAMAIACANGVRAGLTLRQTFLLTTGVWLTLPLFGALPFMLGTTAAGPTDAVFEAMSGLTTTGSTVLTGLDEMPRGVLVWRALLQWFGGIGIIVVAMVFLPELRVGGMQIFRSEGFDTMGKILPRATQIASRISVIYFTLTLAATVTYFALGMSGFDAICHAMTTIATGGMANKDSSFGDYPPAIEYAAVLFMLLAALPFVRYVQLLAGNARASLKDSQIRTFLGTVLVFVLMITAWQFLSMERDFEPALRKSLFNTASILTGTGYASEDFMLWGAFPVTLLFFAGLVGGCAGSTSCSIKVFRYQLLFASISAQIRSIHTPRGLFAPRYEGRPVSTDVLNSVMSFFVMFAVSLTVLSVLLAMTGLDFTTSLSGAVAALANIGPGLGPEIGPAGHFGNLNATAKWLLTAGMLIGRLELMVVYVLLTAAFWQR